MKINNLIDSKKQNVFNKILITIIFVTITQTHTHKVVNKNGDKTSIWKNKKIT